MTDNMRYIQRSGSTWMVKVPSTKQVNFPRGKLEDAIAHRNKMCDLVGLDITKPFRKHYEAHRKDKDHLWLPPGISMTVDRGTKVPRIMSYDARSGKSIGRSFMARHLKRTLAEALTEVIKWRQDHGYVLPESWEFPTEEQIKEIENGLK